MKTRLAIAALGLLTSVSNVVAADVGATVYKAPPPMAPVVNWTGFYVGGNVGYAWGNAQTSLIANGSNYSNLPQGRVWENSNLIPVSQDLASRSSGLSGGGQAGFNFVTNRNWLVGVEVDAQSLRHSSVAASVAGVNSAVCFGVVSPPPQCINPQPITGQVAASIQTQIDWIGTLRGRIGFMPHELSLLYATGGLAYGKVRVNGVFQGSPYAVIDPSLNFVGSNSFGMTDTRFGYALGAGIESKFASVRNWSWRLEYLYVDLGTTNVGGSIVMRSSGAPTFTDINGSLTSKIRFTENILRAGINYTFDWGKAPVVAKY